MTLPVLLLAATPPSGAPNAIAFAESAAIVCVLGVLGGLLLTYREPPRELKPRYMFVLTVSSWFVIALLSAFPFT